MMLLSLYIFVNYEKNILSLRMKRENYKKQEKQEKQDLKKYYLVSKKETKRCSITQISKEEI